MMLVRRFRALTTDVEVVAEGRELAAILGGLVATYPDAGGEPALRYQVDARLVVRGNAVVRTCDHPLDAVAAFELDLYQEVVAGCGDGIVLHAATVVAAGRAVVLAGASGAGKTTLALALFDRGADYVTEECTLIRADGTVLGLARPITRLPDDDGPVPAGIERREIRRRLGDGRIVRRYLLLPPRERIRTVATPLRAVVVLERDPRAPTTLDRLGGLEAIELLRGLSLNSGAGALAGLVGAAGSHPIHRLRSRTVREGADAVGDLLRA